MGLKSIAAGSGLKGRSGMGVRFVVDASSSVSPPVNTVAPVISGLRLSGATLTTTDGTWTNSPTSYTYQWQNAGVDIGGATSATYTVQLTDEGDAITCDVTANNAGGSATEASNALTIIAGLKLFVDGTLSPITQVASAVSQWNDISGNGHHLTQGTGTAQPTTGAATLNGNNVISFDGTSDFMLLPSGLYGLSAGDNTMLFIMGASSGSGTFFQGGGVAAFRYGMRWSGPDIQFLNKNTFVTNGTPNGGVSNKAVGFMRQGTSIVPFVNGSKGTDPNNADNMTMTFFNAGSMGGTSAFSQIEIAAILLFSQKLSDADMNYLGSAYVNGKWGVTWTGF